ncbi:MAG: O-antigen ligase family protein [Lentisphaeria bacterium]|nr:O-antigen ligase family protein [Lentisphaeria bacterium]
MNSDSNATQRRAVTPIPGPSHPDACLLALWRRLLILAFFASYPLALFLPMGWGIPLLFYIGIPSLAILGLGALHYLLLTPVLCRDQRTGHRVRTAYLGGIALAVGLCVLAAMAGRSARLFSVVELSAPILVAALVCVVAPRHASDRLVPILALLWLVQVVHAGLQVAAGLEPVALAGNRNWAASLVAVLTPWAWLWLHRVGRRRGRLRSPFWVSLLQLGAGAVAIALVFACASRATWTALALYGLVVGLLRPATWPGRILLGAALLAVAFGVVSAYPEKVADAIERDIRPPLYFSTIRMIADHPFLGVGPGNFRRAFVSYRSRAQAGRAVAAPVTEHPHNEWLHVTASCGILGGGLWAVVFAVPLFLNPGRGSVRRLAHYSLWLLVVHGMLDKVLVQPPTSVLAAVFAGLLWRPHLRLRAWPARRPPLCRRLLLPVAGLLAVTALAFSVQEVGRGILFRRAYLAEAAGSRWDAAGHAETAREHYRKAFRAYRAAARLVPGDVRTHAYAGINAGNKLRDSEAALRSFQRAVDLEPDFAHINGEIGLALGALGRHEDAFPFFLREVRIFPFDLEPLERLMVCAKATQRTDLLPDIHGRIVTLALRRCTQAFGETELTSRAMTFRNALAAGNAGKTVAVANGLLKPLATRGIDPSLPGLLDRPVIEAVRQADFGPLDWDYWRDMNAAASFARSRGGDTPEALLALVRTLPATTDDRPPPAWSFRPFFCAAGFAGFATAGLRLKNDRAEDIHVVEMRREGRVWLVDLRTDTVVAGGSLASLLTEADLRERLGVDSEDLTGARAVLPIHPLQFLQRTQCLGALIRSTAGPHAVPPTFAPTVEATRLRTALASELTAAGAETDAIKVVFDEEILAAFSHAVEGLVRAGQ